MTSPDSFSATDADGTVSTVPLAAFESAQARSSHTIWTLIVCWAVTVVVLGFALICAMSTTTETTDEYVTTTTSTDVSQDADNSGANYFSNGDLISDGSETDGQTDSTDDQAN